MMKSTENVRKVEKIEELPSNSEFSVFDSTEMLSANSVPTSCPNFDDKTWLKNLAGWMARYKNFDLKINDASPLVIDLLENGTLAEFEPCLKGLEIGCESAEDEYDRYEFNIQFYEFVNIDDDDWAILNFTFKTRDCFMYIECNSSRRGRLALALDKIFASMDVDPLTEENSHREISWQKADEIIIKYLKYVRSPDIPIPPISLKE